MKDQVNKYSIDIIIFIIANLVNVLITCIFFSRTREWERTEYVLGLIIVVLALPVSAIVVYNFLEKREWWTILLPLLFVLYCIVELILDYILKIPFRNTPLLYPYITIFYLGLIALVGYSFGTGKSYGFVTLCTYFLTLFAAWYSYSQVGHG